jgi:hypothetical protein
VCQEQKHVLYIQQSERALAVSLFVVCRIAQSFGTFGYNSMNSALSSLTQAFGMQIRHNEEPILAYF